MITNFKIYEENKYNHKDWEPWSDKDDKGSWYSKNGYSPVGTIPPQIFIPDYDPDAEGTIQEGDYVDFGRNKIGKCYLK